MSAVIAWQSQLHNVHYDKRSQLRVLLLAIIHVLLQHIGIGTGVKSENIRPSQNIPSRFGASQNLPRGRSWAIAPGRLRRLPESTPPSQNITPFLTTIILRDPPRIYPSLSEYIPLFNNSMRRSQNLPLLPRIYPPFQKCTSATLPESTTPSQTTPFQQLYAIWYIRYKLNQYHKIFLSFTL